GVVLSSEVMASIEGVLGSLAQTDPALTVSPGVRPS
ncbi:MAG: hypothetical protein JWO10_1780, partial [Microbacteriaceae bacterium]|nr:hypothetical protein [Microbacteriaceae bacterium]